MALPARRREIEVPAKKKPKTKLFKTGEVVKRSGLSRQTIYQYTAMGLIEEADKTKSGHRLYDESVFLRLKLIRDLNESGYTLRDIKQIFFK
jgi:DNA-binding transcriptional MerR regulator